MNAHSLGGDENGAAPASSSETRTGLWVVADQAASSATNFGGSALAAGLLSAGDFGAWAIAFTVYVFVLAATRTWAGDTALLLVPARDDHKLLAQGSASLAAAVGVVAGIVGALVGLVPDGSIGAGLLGLSIFLPSLLLQDSIRMSLLAQRRAKSAFANDALWLVLAVAALMVLRRTDTQSVFLAMAGWAAPTVLCAAVGLRQLRCRLSLPSALHWVSEARSTSARIFAEYLVYSLSSLLTLQLMLSALREVELVGAVRGAQVLLGPLTVLFAASTSYAIPVMVRTWASGASPFGLGLRQSTVITTAVVAWALAMAAVPRSVGTRVFGSTWDGAQEQLLPITLWFIAMALTVGPKCILRSAGRMSTSLRIHIVLAAVVGGSTAFTTVVVSPRTGVWVFTITTLIGPLLLWVAAAAAHRERRPA